MESEKPFGYMWECPDYFEVDGTKILSASVQGLEGGVWMTEMFISQDISWLMEIF